MRLIDADALMKVIREHDYPLRSHFNSTDNGMFTIGVQQAVDEAPTIDAVPMVRGEWTSLTECSNEGVYCSVCHKKVWKADYAICTKTNKIRSNYCPNCGARMDGEE